MSSPVHTVVARAVTNAAGEHTVLNASGYVTARRERTVSSKAPARLTRCRRGGMKVTEGQILARLDDTNVKARPRVGPRPVDPRPRRRGGDPGAIKEADPGIAAPDRSPEKPGGARVGLRSRLLRPPRFRARLAQQQGGRRGGGEQCRRLAAAVRRHGHPRTVCRYRHLGRTPKTGEMIFEMSPGGFTRRASATDRRHGNRGRSSSHGTGRHRSRLRDGDAVSRLENPLPRDRDHPDGRSQQVHGQVRVGFDKLDRASCPK